MVVNSRCNFINLKKRLETMNINIDMKKSNRTNLDPCNLHRCILKLKEISH